MSRQMPDVSGNGKVVYNAVLLAAIIMPYRRPRLLTISSILPSASIGVGVRSIASEGRARSLANLSPSRVMRTSSRTGLERKIVPRIFLVMTPVTTSATSSSMELLPASMGANLTALHHVAFWLHRTASTHTTQSTSHACVDGC